MNGREITICGGGLAGLGLGILLRQSGVPTTIYEAAPYPRHRVCGEFISGLEPGVFRRLDLGGVMGGARRHREVDWFDRAGSRFFHLRLPVPAVGISRYRLDARLAERFREVGGNLVEQRLRIPEDPEGFVDARGRSSSAGLKKKVRLGLKCHVRDLPLTADLEMHVGKGGYVGLSGVEEGAVNVCGLFGSEVGRKLKKGNEMVSALEAIGLGGLAERVASGAPVEGSFCGTANFRGGQVGQTTAWLSLGDSARQIPPFTGHGMAMALENACLAADPVEAYARGHLTWREAVAQASDRAQSAHRSRLHWAQWLHPLLENGWLPAVVSAGRPFFQPVSGTVLGKCWGGVPEPV